MASALGQGDGQDTALKSGLRFGREDRDRQGYGVVEGALLPLGLVKTLASQFGRLLVLPSNDDLVVPHFHVEVFRAYGWKRQPQPQVGPFVRQGGS